MTFLILAYFGGVLTILSPCILPVLPFVFSGAAGPFRRTGLPLKFFKCGWFDEKDYFDFFPLQGVYRRRD